MLIQFSVANFRSFNQEQTLDLTASNYFSELQENTFRPIKRKKLSLLKAIGIYGANASGKSSLVYALRFMKRQVSTLNREPHEKIDTKPFKLSKTMLSRPSQFEVIFVADNQQYQYGFSCTDKAFTQEWLFINGKPVLERNFNDARGEFEYPVLDLGKEDLVGIDGWKKFASNSNTLFVPKAASNGSHILAPVVNWFSKLIIAERFSVQSSLKQLEDRQWSNRILGFLHQMGLQDVQELSSKSIDISKLSFPDDIPDAIREQIKNDLKSHKDVFVQRKMLDNSAYAEFDLDNEESRGTGALFAFAYPLLDILDKDSVLVVDEIDNSLHPLVVQRIIHYFQNMYPNSRAQLVFTTHDASLLSKNLLRRDQVWFTEKNSKLSTELYSLDQFSPRKEDAIEKRYLSGRYGGVPIMTNLDHVYG